MSVDGVGRTASTGPDEGTPPPSLPAQQAKVPFASVLQQRMLDPRTGIAQVRGEIAAIRDGSAWAVAQQAGPVITGTPRAASSTEESTIASSLTRSTAVPASSVSSTSGATRMAALRSNGGADPYGWRALTREYGDSIVAPGFGAIFERQIDQESGFSPDVVFGTRRSSAGAEGIAQLMPQYYPNVDRTDPDASLRAGAETMRHNLAALGGDVRKALAAYNAGLGTVQRLVSAYGANWESGLPEETRQYLAAIMGGEAPRVVPGAQRAVFGGSGAGGLLTSPVASASEQRLLDSVLELVADGGSTVRAPSDGVVSAVQGADDLATLLIDHGNGWQTSLEGLAALQVSPGERVSRSDVLGVVADAGAVRLGVNVEGRAQDPSRYLLR